MVDEAENVGRGEFDAARAGPPFLSISDLILLRESKRLLFIWVECILIAIII
jgi:hypothetical protein